jgi:hypothetical protein
MTTPYTTHDAVKTKLGISLDPDATLDAYIDGLILSVSALFDTTVWGPAVLDSGFVPDSGFIVEYHDGGANTVILNRLFTDDQVDRLSIVVTEDAVALSIGADFNVDAFPANTIYRSSSTDKFDIPWSPGYRNVKVSYPLAYKTTPDDVVRATDEETARAFKAGNSQSTDGGFIGITGRTPDAGTTLSYTADDLTATTMRMLDGYRKRLSFF